MRKLDKFRGCLLGGAAGDALGYEVEFMEYSAIVKRFGEGGITEYVLHDDIARISDDTQMTLFTATGLLLGTTRGMMRGIMAGYPSYIASSYQDWLRTQQGRYPDEKEFCYSWLVNVPQLYSRRAPGVTCLTALQSESKENSNAPINNSKGCGGIMRVAPIGLYFIGSNMPIEEVDRIGADTAALTHGHELGYIPAAILVHIIYRLASSDVTIGQAVDDAVVTVEKLFPNSQHMPYLKSLIRKAKDLASQNYSDPYAIAQLGQGWVAEETLAIAIYCAMKYPNDFHKALVAAVNHSGDSDSTGAVTGNILGAHLGMEGISPYYYLNKLELCDVITEIADDLYHDCQMSEYGSYYDPVWVKKYVEMTYRRTSGATVRSRDKLPKPMATLTIRQVSITDLAVDCIVNAANTQLQHGGGVCGAIFSAAGAKELQYACNQYGSCPTGEAVLTPGFRLKAKYIAHAVGPRWQGGGHNEQQLLHNCYQNAMKLAYNKGCRSIAFPLISSGIYGYPVRQAWQVAIHAICSSPCQMDVTIAVIDAQALALGNHLLAQYRQEAKNPGKPSLILFDREYEENGCFSPWYASIFQVEGIRYLHCEQYMTAKKALLFHDLDTYRKIMAQPDPTQCKFLGRSIAGFNTVDWYGCQEEIAYRANYAKFSQNLYLKETLLATGDAVLAQACRSPEWGIGLSRNDPRARDPEQWVGANLLGRVLMQVRDALRQEIT